MRSRKRRRICICCTAGVPPAAVPGDGDMILCASCYKLQSASFAAAASRTIGDGSAAAPALAAVPAATSISAPVERLSEPAPPPVKRDAPNAAAVLSPIDASNELYTRLSFRKPTTNILEATVAGGTSMEVASSVPSFFCYYPKLRRKAEALRTSGDHAAAAAFMTKCERSLIENNTASLVAEADPLGGASCAQAIDLCDDKDEEGGDSQLWTWQVRLDTAWLDMHPHDSASIEREFVERSRGGGCGASATKAKAKALFVYRSARASGDEYRVDLDSLRQINTQTHTARPIRRSLR